MTATTRDCEAQAATWDARLRSHDLTAEEREQFAAWKNDKQNAECFDRLQIALSTLRNAADHPQLRGLRESARIIERRSARFGLIRRVAIAASAAVIVGGSIFWLLKLPDVQRVGASLTQLTTQSGTDSWSTGAGELRTVALRDGSSVTLSSSTRLEAVWSQQDRQFRLLAGQALFRVAKDPARPFVVSAGSRTIEALGTTFDVQLRRDALRVTLLDGLVSVKPLKASSPAVELKPSQEFEVVADQVPTVRRIDAVARSAWANGQVVFTDNSLVEAVAEMNQYSPKQIVAAPELARFRINGMFRAGNQDSFVAAVTSYFPIRAHEESGGRIILELNQDPPAHPEQP